MSRLVLEPMPIEQWKAERQQFIDNISSYRKRQNELYRSTGNIETAESIKLRQDAKRPEPGQGLFQFLTVLQTVSRLGTRLHPMFAGLGLAAKTVEVIAKDELGMYD
tara:strand:- start:68 stop:388 length:321 start_codon:yes stop_codon:yes gene_type:complete